MVDKKYDYYFTFSVFISLRQIEYFSVCLVHDKSWPTQGERLLKVGQLLGWSLANLKVAVSWSLANLLHMIIFRTQQIRNYTYAI